MSRLDVILVDLDSLVTVSVTLWYVVHGSLARGGGVMHTYLHYIKN